MWQKVKTQKVAAELTNGKGSRTYNFFQKEKLSEEGSMRRGERGNIFVCKMEKIFLE